MNKLTRWLTLISLIAATLVLALPLPAPISAQGGEVTYNTPVEGSITDTTFEEAWTLTAQGADRIRIRVERTGGNLIPDLWLRDDNGGEVARSYGADNSGAVALIDDVDLPFPGAYTIVVTRDRGAEGLTTGGYSLEIIPLGLGDDHPNLNMIPDPILYDEPVTDTISAAHWRHSYTLTGEAGDLVLLNARRLSGTLTPEVALIDNNGRELRRGYPNDTGETTSFNATELPYTGDYTVIVERQRQIDGSTAGDFELLVHLQGAGEDSTQLNDVEPGAIAQYNTPVSGEITDALWRQEWQFRTEAADLITIEVRRSPEYSPETPNNLKPQVTLLNASGDALTTGYVNNAGNMAVIDRRAVSDAGLYTIQVTREREKDGTTTGTYELTVYLEGSGEGSPFLADAEGALEVGTPATGSLTNSRWMHTWTFSGEEGQEFTFTATRTDGTLIPNLDIRDSNGQSLRYRHTEQTLDYAIAERFRLPYTGEYHIVVLRDRDQDGITTGGYELTAELYEEPQQ